MPYISTTAKANLDVSTEKKTEFTSCNKFTIISVYKNLGNGHPETQNIFLPHVQHNPSSALSVID